jgi:hypothetical protein
LPAQRARWRRHLRCERKRLQCGSGLLLADLHLGILPGSRRVSAVEWQLHIHFGLLRGSELQCPSGQHDRNLPARQLSWKWPGVLGDWPLLLRLGLSERELHDLHGLRSCLHLRCSAELASALHRDAEDCSSHLDSLVMGSGRSTQDCRFGLKRAPIVGWANQLIGRFNRAVQAQKRSGLARLA